MVEKNLEEGDSSQIAYFSSPKSVQNSVEPKPTEVTNESDNNNLQKMASAKFEAPMQQELPASLILIDSKSNLQEISVEQKAPIGDSVTVSSEVDNSGLPSVKEDPYGFPSASNEVDESREAINDLIAMQPSEENTHAMSETLVRLREEVQCTPLHNVQDGASCSDSEKITCETPSAILTKVKEDKPRVMHRLPEHQMSLGYTRQKVPAPVSRSNSRKFLRTDKTFVDTTTHIESVKVAASRFGGSINWKTCRTQPVQGTEHVVLELNRLRKEILVCKQQAEASENTKMSVFNELERTKKLIEELKHDLEWAQTEEAHAKEDFELFQFIVQEMEEGVASDDCVVGKEKLKIIQERHEAVVSKLKLVKDEFKEVQEDYDSLLIERDISIRKSHAALTVSKEAERQVEELTGENNKLKGVLNLAHATCYDAEEHRIGTSKAGDEDCLSWEKDLRQAEEELNQLNNKLSSVDDLKLKLETSPNLLLKLNNELTAYMEAKQIEEAQEQGKKTRKSMQEEISLARNELEEHRKSIDKVRDEVCALKAAAASLKLELSKEKAALATMQQMEAMASITVSSLEVEIQLAQQELEAVQAKEKQSRDIMVELPKTLQDAAQEADEAKSVATKVQEKLRKTKEEVEQAKAGLSIMEFRLQAVLKEKEAAKESERLALDALRALEEGELAVNIEEQGSPQMITLDLDEESEDLVHERTAAAIAQVEVAKESESRSLSRLSEIYKVLEERKRALHTATEQADRATEGKLAMEQELRKWREENGQRRKAGEASKSEVKPSNTAVIIVERNGDTKGTNKEDCYASVHPLSDVSARNSPNDSASLVKTKKTKKLSFFPRIIMFFARKRLRAAK